jgi:LPS sulfotransferase NodH
MIGKRPDSIDLIGPEFDNPSEDPAGRTLIICAAPRTGSYELCRHLIAAGIGVPHEYFNFNYAQRIAERWAIKGDPLGDAELPHYIKLLRRRRSRGGLFATKIQFLQFDRYLRNESGAALFDGACVVHLFRPDVATQYASVRAAVESGRWDFSSRQTADPRPHQRKSDEAFFQEALSEVTLLISEDAGFRGLFILLAICPIFVTTEELIRDAGSIVRRIGQALDTPVNEDALERSIATSAPYGHEQERERATAGLAAAFKKIAFQKRR